MYETYTLSNFIDAVQALLDDNATLYSDNLVTAAIRRALRRVSHACPMYDSTTLSTESGVLEYTLDDFEGVNMSVISVILTDDEGQADPPAQAFYFFRLNGTTPAIRLRLDYGTQTDNLIVSYSEPHTIDELNGAGYTSLSDWLAEILITGAAGYAVQQRAGSRIEANNLDGDTPADLLALSKSLLEEFEYNLAVYADPPAAIAEIAGWQLDDWQTT